MKKILFTLALSLLLTSSVSAAEFNTNLKYGSKGSDVTKLQEFLTEQNLYSGPITGKFFSLTLKAVKDFQRRELISPASGFFGSLTRAKVNEILDNQLVDSNVEEGNDPVIVPESPVSPEVQRLSDLLGAVQNQNVLLQNSLDLQKSEADRLRALADAEQARLQAIEQARVDAENLARQQADTEASKPLYTSEQLKAKYLNYADGGPRLLLFVSSHSLTPLWSDGSTGPSNPSGETRTLVGYTFTVNFSRSGSLSNWGDAKVVFNGQTIINKGERVWNDDGSPCVSGCGSGVSISGLDASKSYHFQIIYPSPGREDSVYEGTITAPISLETSHLNLL